MVFILIGSLRLISVLGVLQSQGDGNYFFLKYDNAQSNLTGKNGMKYDV